MPTRHEGRVRSDRIGASTDVRLHPDRLDQPLRWTRQRRVFVNSLSDLFHADVPDDYVARVFAVMACNHESFRPTHTFQVLTKRHDRLRSLLGSPSFREAVSEHARDLAGDDVAAAVRGHLWPLPNVWLGVTVEDQQRADLRIPALLDTPAAVRFLSCEPLIGPVDLAPHMPEVPVWDAREREDWGIDWVIVGGESGPDARPMHPAWARSLRDQCTGAGVPFFFKQWGEWAAPDQCGVVNARMTKSRWRYESVRFRPNGVHYVPTSHAMDDEVGYSAPGMESLLRVGKRAAGRTLDGRTWDEMPTALGMEAAS